MAENQIVAEDKHRKSRGLSSTQKGQSLTSGAGTILPSSVPSKPNTLKNVANLTSGIVSHSAKAASMISPENKHHHHHHHHHHSHSHHSTPHVIHRTTSESLRLGGTEVNSANTVTTSTGASSPSTNSSSSGTTNTNCKSGGTPQLHLSAPGMRKPKTSSFQITSVTVGNKLSADNGEDSADDLDESHTDDNSRITDLENETPSMSEDTFSKEDVFFSSNALGTAPVIPTSSQYGLVIVDPDLAGVGGSSGQTLSNVHVSVTDAGINIVGPNGGKLNDGDQKDLQHRNERFKVVKIESTEPFKRGRWMCMDYLDHTTLQQTQSTNPESSSPPQTTTGNVLTNDSGAVNISENHVDGGAEVPESTVQPNFHAQSVSPGQTLQNPVSTSSLEQQPPLSQSTTTNSTGTAPPTVIQAQTIGHVPNAAPSSVIPQAQQQQPSQSTLTAQSLPPAQIQQAIAGQLHPPQEPPVTNQQPASSAPEYQGGSAAPSLQGQSQPANFYLSNQQALANPASTHPHGATLPTNIQMQNSVPTNLPCSTQPPPTPQQPPAQHQQQQQTSQQQTAAAPPNAAMAVPLNSEQTAGSTTSSMPQPAVQQQTGTPQPQQQSGTVPAAQSLTTHSAPQSQVSSDTFVPQATAQSYTTPPVPTAAVPSVSSASSISQDITVDVAAPLPVGQAASIVSPGGATAAIPTPATTTLENGSTTGQQAAPATQGIPNVQDTAAAPGVGASPAAAPPTPASQPSTISDPAVLAAAIQAQQLVTASSAAAATLQTQQSVVTGEESQQPAVDTDNESLALALSNCKKPPAEFSTASSSAHDTMAAPPAIISTASPTLSISKRLERPPRGASLQHPNVFTNLALGQCMQKLMGVSSRKIDFREDATIAEEQNPKDQGVPIPARTETAILLNSDPRSSPAASSLPFFSGSLSSSPSQTAASYEPCAANLRTIGKTNSIPVGGGHPCRTESGRSRVIADSPPRRSGSVGQSYLNSASGTSAVAIDNKIEQAMDLVKSHLMIAVREEVEVLKEKIAELMDRINQLELENTILKANVSQETLSQLTQTIQTSSTKTPQNTNTSNGPVS